MLSKLIRYGEMNNPRHKRCSALLFQIKDSKPKPVLEFFKRVLLTDQYFVVYILFNTTVQSAICMENIDHTILYIFEFALFALFLS